MMRKSACDCLEKLELKPAIAKPEARSRISNEEILNMLMVMSHDIRSPLVSVGATLKLLNRGFYGRMDESVGNTLHDLYGRVAKLIGIAEDCLDKASVVKGSLYIEREVLDLKQDIIDPVLDERSADIDKHNIMIDNRLVAIPAGRISIKANKIWLKAIYRNLFSNAIKYGGDGCSIAFGYENHGSYCRLNVYNSGQPIPKENRGKLFTKFGRIEHSGNKGGEGVGLGLYLAKEIIERHGGKIWYEAKEHGSNFVFIFPRD